MNNKNSKPKAPKVNLISMHVFMLITNVFQGENLGINICKEVIIIEFRGHYKTKQNKTKILPRNNSQGSEGFTGKSCQTVRGDFPPILLKLTPIFSEVFQNIAEEGTLSNTFCEATTTLMPKLKMPQKSTG